MGANLSALMTSQKIGSGLTAFGGTFNAVNSMSQGMAEQAYYKYIASQYNQQEKDIKEQATRDTQTVRDKTYQFAATQSAIMAANGVAGSGTSQNILADTFAKGKLDELVILRNAGIQQTQARNNAKMARYSGKNARRAGIMNGFNTLLGTAGQVADSWYRWSQTGANANPSIKSGSEFLPQGDMTGLTYSPLQGGYWDTKKKVK